MNDDIDKIVRYIEKIKKISITESFRFAQICATNLRKKQLEGNKLLIYILDNFHKVPKESKNIWIDLIEMAGFYPYLSKINTDPTSIDGRIRKEFHLSDRLNVYFHEEQKILKYILESDKNLIVSAPTSFGKSLLIEEIVASQKYKNIVIIQPTLALLDETRKKLKKYKDVYKIIIKTTQPPLENKGNLFLLTAERVIEYPELPKIDFLIIDEFYKLSQKRDDERAYILNNAFYKLLKDFQPKFYLLGPNIDGISEGFAHKYNAVFFKTGYNLVESKIVDIYYQHKDKFDHPRKNRRYKEKVLFELLYELGYRKNEQTIIYCSSPKRVRDLAKSYYDFLKQKQEYVSNEELPLVEWIRNYVHEKWNLIELLNYGIGINDGALIKHINSSIVDYFNEGKLKYLFCTTTLIEGVNTSAKNIVFFDKTKGNRKPIDFFDYSNIKGRAGRLMVHYVGKIYNFNPPPEKKEQLIIDIPFYQQNPIEDEVLITLQETDIKENVKKSEQYQKLKDLPEEERELFRKNGVSVWGQKVILEKIKNLNDPYSIMRKDYKKDYTIYELLKWTHIPSYDQLQFIIELCWDNLMRHGETKKVRSKNQLVYLIYYYTQTNDIKEMIKQYIKYYKKREKSSNEEIENNAIIEIFNIYRHWFTYKFPKWLNVVNNIQKYVCIKNNMEPGDYSYYASQLENDFVDDKLSILLEYGIPKSAIEKIQKYIDVKNILDDNELIENVTLLIKKKPNLFLKYEIEKIERNL